MTLGHSRCFGRTCLAGYGKAEEGKVFAARDGWVVGEGEEQRREGSQERDKYDRAKKGRVGKSGEGKTPRLSRVDIGRLNV